MELPLSAQEPGCHELPRPYRGLRVLVPADCEREPQVSRPAAQVVGNRPGPAGQGAGARAAALGLAGDDLERPRLARAARAAARGPSVCRNRLPRPAWPGLPLSAPAPRPEASVGPRR